MAEPLEPDHDAGQAASAESNDSDAMLSEDDLDIDALVSVWKDDLLLDAIGCTPYASDRLDVPFDVSTDRQLVDALLAWRREVESDRLIPVVAEPVRADTEPVRADTMESPEVVRRRPTFRVPLVSALAAAVLLAFTALAAYGAKPNEVLWPVTEVLYSQHAASVRAADDAHTAQTQAEAALAAGHTHEAEAALRAAASRIPQVRSQDGQTQVQNRQHELEKQLENPPGPASKTSTPRLGAPPQSTKPSASLKRSSQPTTRATPSEEPSAQAKKPDAVVTQTGSAAKTSEERPTSEPTSASSAPPRHRVQPDGPPPPSRSTGPTPVRSTPSAPRTNAGTAQDGSQGRVSVRPSKGKSPRTTLQPKARTTPEPVVGRTVEPSSSRWRSGDLRTEAPPRSPDPPSPTSRPSATPPDDQSGS